MKIREIEYQGLMKSSEDWTPENVIEIEKKSLHYIVEKICRNKECRYPLLAVRILIHVITSIDGSGKVYISARQLSKSLDVHYDTVTKCLKFLREIEVLRLDKK